MNLSPEAKNRLVNAAEAIYRGYIALDFFKSQTLFTVDKKPATLLSLCLHAVSTSTYSQTLFVQNRNYELVLTRVSSSGYEVALKRILPNEVIGVKPWKTYTPVEALQILSSTQQQFLLEISPQGTCAVTLMSNNGFTLGGPGTFDLYRTHLVTLNNIIMKIKSDAELSQLLVALATGAGKTYVQALWLHILYLSNNTGIFAVPDTLVPQFYKDLERLLPMVVIQDICIVRLDTPEDEANNIFYNLKTSRKIIIASAERVLDEYYPDILNASPDNSFLIFDEQHLLMKEERRRLRLLELSDRYLSMYLTATPNLETYAKSGFTPVAMMSIKHKLEAGHGQSPQIYSSSVKLVADLSLEQKPTFGSTDYKTYLLNRFLLRFSDGIQQEYGSAAMTLIDELPFYLHRTSNDLRWGLQVPMASKMLCLIDDNESLINFYHFLKTNSRAVYHQGNFVVRHGIAEYFQIPDVDQTTLAIGYSKKHQDYMAGLAPGEKVVLQPMINNGVQAQLKSNIFHYFIEYVLSDLSGKSTIEHNELRKANLDAFTAWLKTRVQTRSRDYFQKKLAKIIDEQGAAEISFLLERISLYFAQLNGAEFKDFVDNWFLNREIYNGLCFYDPDFCSYFDEYSSRHLVVGLMSGMTDAETPIFDSKPFYDLDEDCYPLYDAHGIGVSTAKKRQRTTLELLNNLTMESRLEPKYLGLSEEVIDQYFRLGFIGIYVTNKKTEGFSDPNLLTAINITEHKLSVNNSPGIHVQFIGRLRGLDETAVPSYIHVSGHQQGSSFKLDTLNNDDYYPGLFQAQSQYDKAYIGVLGEQVGKDIVAWYYKNQNADETIDPDRLKRHVLICIAKALRHLNSKADQNIILSRAQLTHVIAHAMQVLNQEINHINNPYQMTLFARLNGSSINFIGDCYYVTQKTRTNWQLSRFKPKCAADSVYLSIVMHSSYKALIAQTVVIAELKSWMTRKTQAIKYIIQRNLQEYIKPDYQKLMAAHQRGSLWSEIACEPVIKGQVVALLSRYIQHGLWKHLSAFMTYPDAKIVASSLVDSSKISEFIHQLLLTYAGREDMPSAELIFSAFKTMFSLPHVMLLPEKISTLSQKLTSFKEARLDAMARVIHEKSLPCLVNFYPVSDRQMLMEQVTIAKIKALLIRDEQTLASYADRTPDRVADYFFSSLCREPLPQQTTIEAEKEKLNKFIAKQKKGVAAVINGFAALTGTSPQRITKLLNTDEFLEAISAMLPFDQWLQLKDVLNTSLDKRKQLGAALDTKIHQELKPADFIATINEIFGTEFQDTESCGIESMDLLKLLSSSQLTPAEEDEMAALIQLDGLPILAAFIKDDSKKEQFLSQFYDSKSLMTLMLKHKDKFSCLTTLKPEEQHAFVLELIQALSPNLVRAGDLINPAQHALEQQKLCQEECFLNFLDREKVADLMLEQLSAVVSHAQFKTSIRLFIGSLTQADVTLILQAAGRHDPAAAAARLILLQTLIDSDEPQRLKNEFMSISEERSFDFADIPLLLILDDYATLVQEVILCHSYYNQHDNKGWQGDEAKPAILPLLSAELKAIRVPMHDTFLSRSTRRVFFIQGIRNGLVKAAEVSADSNRHHKREFQRINNHLLRPLWWTVSASKLGVAVVRGIIYIASAFRDLLLFVWNGLKAIVQALRSQTVVTQPEVVNPEDIDYNEVDETIKVAEDINNLTPLTPAQVLNRDCPVDVVRNLEEKIETLPRRRLDGLFYRSEGSAVGRQLELGGDEFPQRLS